MVTYNEYRLREKPKRKHKLMGVVELVKHYKEEKKRSEFEGKILHNKNKTGYWLLAVMLFMSLILLLVVGMLILIDLYVQPIKIEMLEPVFWFGLLAFFMPYSALMIVWPKRR